MKISTKLTGIAGIMLILLLVENGLHTRNTRQIGTDTARYLQTITPAATSVGALAAEIERLARRSPGPDVTAEDIASVRLHLEQVRAGIREGVRQYPTTKDDWQQLADGLDRIDRALAAIEAAQTQTSAPPRVTAGALAAEIRPAMREYQENLATIRAAEIGRISRTTQAHIRLQRLLTAGLCSMVLLMALVLGRSVIMPLRSLAATVRAVAAGNRDIRIERTNPDELGDLATALNDMLELDGVVRDVTTTRQAAAVLREDVQYLTRLFMAAPAATSLSDSDTGKFISSINANLSGTCLYRMIYHADGRIACSYISPNVENVLGVPAATFKADGASFLPLVHPEDLPSLRRAMAHGLRTGGATSLTVRVNHPDGRQRWMQFRSRFVEKHPDGSQVRDGVVVDVTAYKVAQARLAEVGARLELALRSSRTSTWHNDAAANRMTLDPAWSEMLGHAPQATVTTARQLMTLVPPDDLPVIYAEVRKITKGKADDFLAEHRVRTAQAGWIWIRSLGRVIERDAQGKPLRIVGTNTDITSRKLTEEKMRRQAEFLASLHETSLDLLNRRDLPDLLKALTVRAGSLLRAPLVELLLREGETLAVHAYIGDVHPGTGRRLSRDEAPLCWQALEAGQTQTVEDYSTWPHQSNPYDNHQAQSVLALPILRGEERLGVLCLARKTSDQPFTPEEVQRGEMLARQTALILHNANTREDAIREAEMHTTALRLSEERFRSIFDRSPFAIIIAALPETRLVDANQAALRLFKTGRDRLIGRTARELDHWVSEAERRHYLSRLRNDGRIESMEVQFRKSDGEIFTALLSGSVIQLNHRPHVLSVLLDITERKQADQARARSLAMLRATLESTADGILAVSSEGRVESYNHTFAAMWRLPPETLATHDDARLLEAARQQLAEPDVFSAKIRYLREHPQEAGFDLLQFKDGRIIERFSRPMLVDGQPSGRVWSFRDITERKRVEAALRESEQRFRGVFDHSPVAIALFSMPEGRFLQCNAASEKTFGYTAAEMADHTSTDLGLWADLTDRRRYLALLQEHHHALDFEALMRRKDGSLFTALFNGTLVNIDGHPFSLNSIQDITARKAAEKSVAEALQEKENLLREVHHRVKNNLQIISSLLHFQAKKAGARQLAVFNDGQNRLRAMILVHEKLYRSADLYLINLGDYVHGLAEQLQRTFHGDGQRIRLHIESDDISAPVEIALPCGMIVTELVTNAFKYAFPAGDTGLVHIDIARTGAGFTLRIKDNGQGLPPDFDLHQADSFGLQLINNLTVQLNARLTRKAGPGTEIIIEVPFVPRPNPA